MACFLFPIGSLSVVLFSFFLDTSSSDSSVVLRSEESISNGLSLNDVGSVSRSLSPNHQEFSLPSSLYEKRISPEHLQTPSSPILSYVLKF